MVTAEYDRFDDITRVATPRMIIVAPPISSSTLAAAITVEQAGDLRPPFSLAASNRIASHRLFLDFISDYPFVHSGLTLLIDDRLRARPQLQSEQPASYVDGEFRLRFELPPEILRLLADAESVELRLDRYEVQVPGSALLDVSRYVAYLDGEDAEDGLSDEVPATSANHACSAGMSSGEQLTLPWHKLQAWSDEQRWSTMFGMPQSFEWHCEIEIRSAETEMSYLRGCTVIHSEFIPKRLTAYVAQRMAEQRLAELQLRHASARRIRRA